MKDEKGKEDPPRGAERRARSRPINGGRGQFPDLPFVFTACSTSFGFIPYPSAFILYP
jgi:hypothetical protein